MLAVVTGAVFCPLLETILAVLAPVLALPLTPEAAAANDPNLTELTLTVAGESESMVIKGLLADACVVVVVTLDGALSLAFPALGLALAAGNLTTGLLEVA